MIVVVGMNPAKKYLVSPDQRAELLRRMLRNATNVQVQGTYSNDAGCDVTRISCSVLQKFMLIPNFMYVIAQLLVDTFGGL